MNYNLDEKNQLKENAKKIILLNMIAVPFVIVNAMALLGVFNPETLFEILDPKSIKFVSVFKNLDFCYEVIIVCTSFLFFVFIKTWLLNKEQEKIRNEEFIDT